MNDAMNHVRDLLSVAADTVGWQIDLDQLPVTCAQHPAAVLTLIDASAAHLAALTGQGILDEAAGTLRAVMDGADTRDVDREARLLATTLNLRGAHRRHHDPARRRLIAALRDLQPHGATWPPPPAAADSTDAGVVTDLPTALTDLGLRPVAATTATAVYAAEHGGWTVTATIHPDDGDTVEIHVFDRGVVAWSATFSPGTPATVALAAIRAAVPATATARRFGVAAGGDSQP